MIEQLLIESLRGFRAHTILDIGPGFAGFSRLSAEITGAASITFVDSDQAVLAFQLEQCRRKGIDARCLTTDFSHPEGGIALGSFDLIHCQEVLEHLEKPREFLTAVAQFLNPCGRIVVTVPSGISERWIKFLNPAYMRNEPHGHVQEFSRKELIHLTEASGIRVLSLVPAQPHYFLAHTWMAVSRMNVEGSTGSILTRGVRGVMFNILLRSSKRFFAATGVRFWGRIFPRNYFLLGERPA